VYKLHIILHGITALKEVKLEKDGSYSMFEKFSVNLVLQCDKITRYMQ